MFMNVYNINTHFILFPSLTWNRSDIFLTGTSWELERWKTEQEDGGYSPDGGRNGRYKEGSKCDVYESVLNSVCVNMSVSLADYDSIKWKWKRCWSADHKPDRNVWKSVQINSAHLVFISLRTVYKHYKVHLNFQTCLYINYIGIRDKLYGYQTQ